MDDKKKYEMALERAKEELGSGCFNRGSIEYIFPELKDVADILYCDGRMTKEEYDLIRSKYEFYSNKDEKERENPGIYNTVYKK